MYDLPPLTSRALEVLKGEISSLKRGGDSDDPKPHKLIMLLAVIELADRDLLKENKIFFNETLWKIFSDYFVLIRGSDDWCQPAPPFFHLRTSGFWHLQPKQGREEAYAKLKTSGGGNKRILENIEYAYLSDYAFLVINDPDARNQLRKHIVSIINPNLPNHR